ANRNACNCSVIVRVVVANRLRIQRSSTGSDFISTGPGVYPSRFISKKREAFQSLFAKLRPCSNRSEPCFAVGNSGSASGQGPPGRNGFLHDGQLILFVRMYMCSFLTGTLVLQCGQTFAT